MRRLRIWLKAAVQAASAAVLAGAVFLLHLSPAFGGAVRYEYYGAPSSNGEIVCSEEPLLLAAAGESAVYEGDCYEALRARFCAELVFCEEAAGVTSYYLFSPFLGQGVRVAGERINLHIAVRDGQTAAGTPLIFGGF